MVKIEGAVIRVGEHELSLSIDEIQELHKLLSVMVEDHSIKQILISCPYRNVSGTAASPLNPPYIIT